MTELHRAIVSGSLSEVQRLTELGIDLNHVHGMQGTALSNAIASKQTQIALYIIEAGCDVNVPDFDGEPPLMLSLRKNDFAIATALINHHRCQLDAIDPVTGQTALCYAAGKAFVDIVLSLLDTGRVDCKKSDVDGNTALHLALLNKHYEVLRILQARQQELKVVWNKAGLMAVHVAALHGDTEGLDILYPSRSGLQQGLSESLQSLQSSCINPCKDLNIRTRYTNDTALHCAVREGKRDMVERLIERGVDVNLKNNTSQTALLIACCGEDLDLVSFLLSHGADPNKAGTLCHMSKFLESGSRFHLRNLHSTPLGTAAFCDNVSLAEILVEHEADICQTADDSHSPLFIALNNNSPSVAMFLMSTALDKGIDISESHKGKSLMHAVVQCTEQAYELTCFLIGLGCSVDSRDRMNNLPLHEAINFENVDVVQAILDEGGNEGALDGSDTPPIHLAAMVGNVKIAQILLSHGAEVNMRGTEDFCTPLLTALDNEMTDFAKFLIHCGARLAHEEYAGVHSDFFCIDDEINEWLLQLGSSPDPLQVMCLDRIRKIFRMNGKSFSDMSRLPLPGKLLDKLFYKDVQDFDSNDTRSI